MTKTYWTRMNKSKGHPKKSVAWYRIRIAELEGKMIELRQDNWRLKEQIKKLEFEVRV